MGPGRGCLVSLSVWCVAPAIVSYEGEIMAVVRFVLALAGFRAGAAAGALMVTQRDERGEWPPARVRSTASRRLRGRLVQRDGADARGEQT